MKPWTALLVLAGLCLWVAPAAQALEESISLIPIEPNLFHHNPPTYTKYAYSFADGLVTFSGSWSAAADGGTGQGAWAGTVPGFEKGSKALSYRWDLRPGRHTRTSLTLVPGRQFTRIDLVPGDGIFFRARSLGKELDNYPNRYVLVLEGVTTKGTVERFRTDYFEVEGIWGTYYIPVDRFRDAVYDARGAFAQHRPPLRLARLSFVPVTNKCRASELLIDGFRVYTTGSPTPGDLDGDGIPNPQDRDGNQNGLADYAESPDGARVVPLEGYVLYGGSWKARCTMPKRAIEVGETFRLWVELTVRSEVIARSIDAFPEFVAILAGERMFDRDGRYGQFSDHMISTLLTPTGLPIENIQPGIPSRHIKSPVEVAYSSPIDLLSRAPRKEIQVEGDRVRMRFAFEQVLDYSVPEGHYRFQLTVGVLDNWGKLTRFQDLPSVIRSLTPVSRETHFRKYVQPEESLVFVRKTYLPLVKIGRPAVPRLPWALLFHRESHGARGIVPEEEKGRWGLNFRNRLAGRPIFTPGVYNLEPGLPSLVYERLNVHHRMSYRRGEMTVTVRDPEGKEWNLGTAGFVSPTRWGVSTNTGKFLFRFHKYGKYTVRMTGTLYDECGNVYRGGGTYHLWIAHRITFGTFPSLPYEVGMVFHGAVEVVPAVPARMRITLRHHPYSTTDPERIERFQTEWKKADAFGLYVPPKKYRFTEPGEYFSHIEAEYTDRKGRLWLGSLYGASVVAPKNSVMVAHGRGWYMANGQVTDDRPRYNLGTEGELEKNIEQYLFYPYYAGDVLYVASSMDFKNEIYPLMTMEFLPFCPRCGTTINTYNGITPLEPYKGWSGRHYACPRCGTAVNPESSRPKPYEGKYPFNPKMTPIFCTTTNGWSPHCYREKIDRLVYFYTDAWRPGVNARHLVGEGNMMNSYWPTSPSVLGNQLHAGHNGDLPGDFYRFTSGVVYRNLKTGRNNYAIYSAFGVVIPKGSNANRVVEFGKEPLFSLLGRDHYIFLGGGVLPVPGMVLMEGGRVPAAGATNPPVPAELTTEVESPSGQVWTYRLKANNAGVFPRLRENTTPLNEPGVWKARQKLSYKGRTGDVLGSGDGEYVFYVLPRDTGTHVDITIHQPDFFRIEPDEILQIAGEVPEEVVEGTIHYTAISPGLILDYGSRPVIRGQFVYKFFPKELAWCYPFYDTVNYFTGKPQLTDTVVINLFLEGRTREGKKVYGMRQVTLRGQQVINLQPLWK
jgi:hypothetical protein